MKTIDILEVFEKCINGRGGCDVCPYKEGYKAEFDSTCIARLGNDVINYANALKEHVEYYEEVIEEYETAELERKELVDKIADTPYLRAYDAILDDCTTTTTTTTISGSAIPAEGLASTSSITSAFSLGYDPGSLVTISSSSKWELESAVEKAVEAVEAELKKKDKKPRWFEKWTEKT